MLMFRRCAMAVAGSIFEQRADQVAGDSGSPLVRLGPSARQELVLLAVLAPLLSSCVSVPYDRRLFASDASLRKGAYTHMRPDLGVIKALWLSADARGFYTKLDGPLRASLAALGVEPFEAPSPEELSSLGSAPGQRSDGAPAPVLQRPLGQRFDFLLVGPGPPGLVQQLRAAGLCCGPVIDESVSRHFRLDCPDVTEWAMHLVSQGRVGFLALAVPSGALSASVLSSEGAPALANRSRHSRGRRVASGCLALFWLAWRARAPCLLLLGGTSCVASSPRLGYLRSLPGVVCRPRACCSSRGCSSGSLLLCATGLEPSALDFRQLPPAVCSLGRSCPPGHCPVLVRALAGLVQMTLASSPDPATQKVGFESLL